MMNIWLESQEARSPKLPKLTFQADPLRGLATPMDFALAASREHLSFFESLSANRPIGASLLDFEHQALLRRLSIAEPLSVRTLLEYFSEEGRRKDLLYQGLELEKVHVSEVKDSFDETWREFAPITEARVFNNRFGFARFSPGTTERWNEQLVETLLPSLMTSVGAGIYFCFSVFEHPDRVFLQEGSVRLLADTMACYGEAGVPPSSRDDDRHKALCQAIRESFPEPMRQREQIFYATKDFLIRHEVGHAFGSSRSCVVSTVIKDATGNWWEPVPVAFPTDHQLGAWNRIKRGEGTIDDVCFVFGDFFANVVAYQSGLPESSVSLLKAFHWWVVPPANESRMPRGGAIFLKLLYDHNLEGTLRDLNRLFRAAVKSPATVSRLMLEMECASWSWLKSEVLR